MRFSRSKPAQQRFSNGATPMYAPTPDGGRQMLSDALRMDSPTEAREDVRPRPSAAIGDPRRNVEFPDDPLEILVGSLMAMGAEMQRTGWPKGEYHFFAVSAMAMTTAVRSGDPASARAAYRTFLEWLDEFEAGRLGTFDPNTPWARVGRAAADFRSAMAPSWTGRPPSPSA